MSRDERRLDEEELGVTAQLLYEAFHLIEGVGGSLSPYVPTQEYVASILVDIAAAMAEARWRSRGARGVPVYYEPGCGSGRVAAVAAEKGLYTLCLELDEYLAREARGRVHPLLGDVVVGDLTVFRPRRVEAVYAYLLPRAVRRTLEALAGTGAAVLSLDYPAEGSRGAWEAARLIVEERSVYAYEA